MRVSFSSKGDWKRTESFLKKMAKREHLTKLDALCARGAIALAAATPVDTGETANSWGYKITDSGQGIIIDWTNSSVIKTGEPIAILLQYGHGTGTGGYVEGIDYINPAMKSIFKNITDQALKVVSYA
jgi:hypothetical protein